MASQVSLPALGPDRIPVYKSLMEAEEIAAATSCLERGWLGMGREVGELEHAIHDAVDAGDRHVAVLSTGHAALHLGMLVAGVGPGDEVILPAFTHLADVQAVLNVGGSPVFCDIDPLTLCIDIDRAAELVTPATKALLVMDYGCHLCDHDAAAALARRHGLRIVHDAAHAFGSSYRGQPVGSFSDICMFSFDPVKAISAIDGGALVLRTEEEVRRVQRLRILGSDQSPTTMYGNSRSWDYDATEEGFRYHLSNVHAAIGKVQITKLDRIRSNRQASCRLYQERLKEVDAVEVPATDFEGINPFLYAIRVDRDQRHALRLHLDGLGIDTGLHWHPAHHMSRFAGFRRGPLEITERIGAEIVSLPLHSDMPDHLVERVCDGIASYFA